MNKEVRKSTCACGKVCCSAIGEPIFSAVCYCDDCQAGGREIETLPDAIPVLEPDGGTAYLTYRDDRFECVEGAELLVGHKLSDNAPTQRFVATCCNTAVYVKFAPGFWVSAYRSRFAEDVPTLQWRNQTKFRTSSAPMPDNIPTYHRFPLKLFGKLINARISMFLGR